MCAASYESYTPQFIANDFYVQNGKFNFTDFSKIIDISVVSKTEFEIRSKVKELKFAPIINIKKFIKV